MARNWREIDIEVPRRGDSFHLLTLEYIVIYTRLLFRLENVYDTPFPLLLCSNHAPLNSNF